MSFALVYCFITGAAILLIALLHILGDEKPKKLQYKSFMNEDERKRKYGIFDYILGRKNIENTVQEMILSSCRGIEMRILTQETALKICAGVIAVIAGFLYYNIETRFKAFENKIDMSFEVIQTQINSEFQEQYLKIQMQNKEIAEIKEDIKEIKAILKERK